MFWISPPYINNNFDTMENPKEIPYLIEGYKFNKREFQNWKKILIPID